MASCVCSTSSTTGTSVPSVEQYVRVYFMIDDPGQRSGPFVRPVARRIEPTQWQQRWAR